MTSMPAFARRKSFISGSGTSSRRVSRRKSACVAAGAKSASSWTGAEPMNLPDELRAASPLRALVAEVLDARIRVRDEQAIRRIAQAVDDRERAVADDRGIDVHPRHRLRLARRRRLRRLLELALRLGRTLHVVDARAVERDALQRERRLLRRRTRPGPRRRAARRACRRPMDAPPARASSAGDRGAPSSRAASRAAPPRKSARPSKRKCAPSSSVAFSVSGDGYRPAIDRTFRMFSARSE